MRSHVALIITALSLAACNDGGLVADPVESPTPEPTATPAQNEPPIADISGSPMYAPNETAHFDGWFSWDPDGWIVGYQWSLVSAPTGSVSNLTPSGDGSAANLFIDLAGDYTVQLTVTDDGGLTDSETFTFSAAPVSLHVQLDWPAQYGDADMDLHLVATSAATPAPAIWSSAYDCYYSNCKTEFGDVLDWGVAGPADNPRLDVDNVTIDVPENTVIATPADGTYRVLVHYYLPHLGGGDIPVDVAIKVWLGTSGTPVFTANRQMTATDQVWEVADIVWLGGNGTVSPIDNMTTTTKPGFLVGGPGKTPHPSH